MAIHKVPAVEILPDGSKVFNLNSSPFSDFMRTARLLKLAEAGDEAAKLELEEMEREDEAGGSMVYDDRFNQ